MAAEETQGASVALDPAQGHNPERAEMKHVGSQTAKRRGWRQVELAKIKGKTALWFASADLPLKSR